MVQLGNYVYLELMISQKTILVFIYIFILDTSRVVENMAQLGNYLYLELMLSQKTILLLYLFSLRTLVLMISIISLQSFLFLIVLNIEFIHGTINMIAVIPFLLQKLSKLWSLILYWSRDANKCLSCLKPSKLFSQSNTGLSLNHVI